MEEDVTGLFFEKRFWHINTTYWQQEEEREDVCKYLEFSTSVLVVKTMDTKDLWERQRQVINKTTVNCVRFKAEDLCQF